MNKQDQKQLTRAAAQGRGAYLRALAVIHRSGSTRTQREIATMIEDGAAWDEFTRVNGALLHWSET